MVLHKAIIFTCNIGYTHHTLSLCIPIRCLDFMNREDIVGPYGVIFSILDKDVLFNSMTYLLPQDYHWIRRPDFFNIFRINSGLLCCLYLPQYPSFVIIIFKSSLVFGV